MQYYRHYIGDFSRKTAHLSITENGAYRKLLDHYYALEKPLPASLDALCRIVGAQTDMERQAVKSVADAFFPLGPDKERHNTRADEEIGKAQQAIDKMREAGYEGAQRRWGKEPDREPYSLPYRGSGRVAIEEPSTIHHPINLLTSKTQEPSKVNGHDKALCSDTWANYASAYASRYQTEPVRNAKTNSQVKQLVERLGAESPSVAGFYLTHNNPFYVRSRHPIGALLKDAEGLRTQWATGIKATGLEARSAEKLDAVAEQVKRLKGQQNV